MHNGLVQQCYNDACTVCIWGGEGSYPYPPLLLLVLKTTCNGSVANAMYMYMLVGLLYGTLLCLVLTFLPLLHPGAPVLCGTGPIVSV